jgi:hypothetical protein
MQGRRAEKQRYTEANANTLRTSAPLRFLRETKKIKL